MSIYLSKAIVILLLIILTILITNNNAKTDTQILWELKSNKYVYQDGQMCNTESASFKHGEIAKFYSKKIVPFWASCEHRSKFCHNGAWIGNNSYKYIKCNRKKAKLLTWNLLVDGWEYRRNWDIQDEWRFERKDRVIRRIRQYNVDIMLLQEVSSEMFHYLKTQFPEYHSVHRKSGRSRSKNSGDVGVSGNAIFSKTPLKNRGAFLVDPGKRRTCAYAETLGDVLVMSCHLPPPRRKSAKQNRRRYSAALRLSKFLEHFDRIILGGDFNTQRNPDLGIYEIVKGPFSGCGKKGKQPKGVDFIFSSHFCNTENVIVDHISNRLSDHPGIIVILDFDKKVSSP